jgi:predicted RNase H-like HicB family nuclease
MPEFNVVVSRDAEAKVWFVESSDIPGLNVEAASFEALVEIVLDAAPELIETNIAHDSGDLPTIPLNIMHAVTAKRLHHA